MNTKTLPVRTRQENTGLELLAFTLGVGVAPTLLWTRSTLAMVAGSISRGEAIDVYINTGDSFDRPGEPAILNSRSVVMVREA